MSDKVLFPSWRYHKTLPACIVQNPEEEAALGLGWRNTPWTVPDPEPPTILYRVPADGAAPGLPEAPAKIEPAKRGRRAQ